MNALPSAHDCVSLRKGRCASRLASAEGGIGYATKVDFGRKQHLKHGLHVEARALSNGNLLAEYEFPDEETENATARKHAPRWVQCVER